MTLATAPDPQRDQIYRTTRTTRRIRHAPWGHHGTYARLMT